MWLWHSQSVDCLARSISEGKPSDNTESIARTSAACLEAFGIDETEALRLREAVFHLSPSPLITDVRRIFDYGRQHEIPERVLDLYWRTRELSLSQWEQEAIRVSPNSPMEYCVDARNEVSPGRAPRILELPTSGWIALEKTSSPPAYSKSGRVAIIHPYTSMPQYRHR